MLLHLYSSYKPAGSSSSDAVNNTTHKPIRLSATNGRPNQPNGHARVPNGTLDRQAHDAQEFELEGLMSDDEEGEAGFANGNGKARHHA